VDLGPGDPTVIVYQYDIANRIEYVDDQSYTWDDNGNLLSDSSATYTYNHANRLASVTDPTLTASFAYNGLGDRLQQIVNGQTTTYTLDIVGGLTQVLADDTHTYLYGNGRIAQYVGTNPEYFLADVLGSVRQLTDSSGNVTLAKGYQPYGQVLESAGDVTTAYGYTGEWTDSYIKLIYLRSRWYSPQTGRFTTRDTWQGDYTRPLSLNWWNYVEGDPINRVDPSGKWYCQSGFAPLTSDCLSWVQDALDKLETSGTTGKKLVEFFHARDQVLTIIKDSICHPLPLLMGITGIKIYFEPYTTNVLHANAYAIWPDQIHINSSLSGYSGSFPSDVAVVTFGHEISHLAQGIRELSVQAEVLSTIVGYYLENDIGVSHRSDALFIIEDEKLDPWSLGDLQLYEEENHLPWPLIWGNGLPRNWLDQWSITLPYPISSPPQPVPVPTPSPALPATPVP
jgi:RHS repeat-associated protein